ncbi:NUDIX hydrolase [Candidatus Saccharibacteria bacterium]|nr:NUDIX hydrolase [Candidatus Saccharibacteria bacterium]
MTVPSMVFVSTSVEKDGQILMIQEGKNNYGQRGKWNFPAGHVEPGESLIEGAIRETKEETGYDVKINGLLSIRKKDFDDRMAVIFFFKGSLIHENRAAPEEETLDIRFVPIDDIGGLDTRFSELADIAKLVRDGKIYPLDILAEGSDER